MRFPPKILYLLYLCLNTNINSKLYGWKIMRWPRSTKRLQPCTTWLGHDQSMRGRRAVLLACVNNCVGAYVSEWVIEWIHKWGSAWARECRLAVYFSRFFLQYLSAVFFLALSLSSFSERFLRAVTGRLSDGWDWVSKWVCMRMCKSEWGSEYINVSERHFVHDFPWPLLDWFPSQNV